MPGPGTGHQGWGVHVDLVVNPTDCPAPAALEAARLADEVGFDGVWLYDHLSGVSLGGDWALEPWTMLGAIAATTSRVAVGPLVANVTTRHPATLAVAAATLQDVSGGRAVLGLGAGAGPESAFAAEMTMVGMSPRPAADRRAMVVEAIEVIRRIWDGRADYAGDHFGLAGARGFLRPEPVPPIIVGANGPKLAAAAAPLADGMNFHSFEPHLDALVGAARAAAGSKGLLVTVQARLEPEWWEPGHSNREAMLALGVDRLMLEWRAADGTGPISEAAGHFEG